MSVWSKTGDQEQHGEYARGLLNQRALQIGQKPTTTDADEAMFWLAEFPLGEDRYAVPLHAMRAALPLKGVTPVPLAPSHVIGILRFQGQVITVLSLASLLGNPGWREDPQTLLVLELGARTLVAVDCEQIPTPTALPRRMVEQARALPNQGKTAAVVVTSDKRQIHLLDVHLLLDRRRERRETDGH